LTVSVCIERDVDPEQMADDIVRLLGMDTP
jgi:hypothetical protein